MRFLLSILIVLFALTSFTEACAKSCKTMTNSDFPGCNLQVEACGCVDWLLRVTYIVQLCDPTSNFCADSNYQKDKNYAGNLAAYNFFSGNRGCNCQTQDVPLGTCNIRGQICAYFPSVDAVVNKQAQVRVFAKDLATNLEGYAAGFAPADAAQGILAAIQNLNTKESILDKCGVPIPSVDKLSQSFLNLTSEIPQMSENAQFIPEY